MALALHSPFGSVGAWLMRHTPLPDLTATSRAVEQFGFETVWISGGLEPGVFDVIETVLEATEQITVAIGVVNLWAETPRSVTEAWHRLEDRHSGRLYVGLGISHAPLVNDLLNVEYSRPMATVRRFLDELDAERNPLPPGRRFLGALGPRMVELSAERTLGAHPYLVSPRQVAGARRFLGDGILAPEVGVVLQNDIVAARTAARSFLSYYLALPNYLNNWLRAGFTADDIEHGGSDRLVDSLFALGSAADVAHRVAEYRAAGADHVALQVVDDTDRIAVYRALAEVLELRGQRPRPLAGGDVREEQ